VNRSSTIAIEGIEAAITDAKSRIAHAKAAAAIEVEREKRQQVLRLCEEAGALAIKIDELWRQSIAEYLLLQDKLHEIAQSGLGRPSRHQVQSVCRRALTSAFIGSPLQLELLAKSERHSVAEVVASWTRSAKVWAHQAIGPATKVNGTES
jgi:hypothetical protein